MAIKVTTIEITNAITSTCSMASAAKSLGLNFSTFKRYAKKYGFYEPNQGNKGVQIPIEIKRARLDDILNGNDTRIINSHKLKSRLLSSHMLVNSCTECGICDTWNGKSLTLQLDHIDGNPRNNKLDNLRILCPNCHSQTHTFAGKNRKRTTQNPVDYTKLQQIIDKHKPKTMRELLTVIGITDSQMNYNTVNQKLIKYNVQTQIPIMCISCGKQIVGSGKTGMCASCVSISQRKVDRPSRELLIIQLKEYSVFGLSKILGVSDNAIRKWMITYSIPTKRNELRIFLKNN